MMSYRGYSGSTGTPSERKNVADAKRAYDTLVGMGTLGTQIVAYGESLGTGVAVQVAADKPVAGLILDAPLHVHRRRRRGLLSLSTIAVLHARSL